MLKRLFVILVVAAAAPAAHSAEGRLGLADLPRLVRDNNLRVQAALDFRRAAERETGAWRRSFTPEISAAAGRETFRTGTEERRTEPFGSVGAELNVFRSGQDRFGEGRARAEARAAQAEYDLALRGELQAARDAFWTLAFQREMERVLAGAMKNNEAFLEAAQRQINSGIATSTDRLEFEMFRRRLEEDLSRLNMDARRAEKTLYLLTRASAAVATPEKIPHDHDAPLLSAAFDTASHPSVRGLDAARAGARALAAQAGRWWAPSVDLYSNYSLYTFREREHEDRSDRDETVMGGKVSLRLLDMNSRAGARASSLRAGGFEKSREQAERELLMEAELAQEELQHLHDLVHSAEENVELGERYLKATMSEYKRGVKNSPDLISALEKNVELKERYAAIRRDYQSVKARLLAILGE